MPTLRRAAVALTVLLLGALLLAGCTGSHSGKAASAASSAAANPTYSQDIATLESELLASYQKNFSPVHPVKSMEATLHSVFPSASLSATATFAVDHLTTAMAHKTDAGKAARQDWAQLVVTHVLAENPNATASPGSAVIPGVTASPSTTGSK